MINEINCKQEQLLQAALQVKSVSIMRTNSAIQTLNGLNSALHVHYSVQISDTEIARYEEVIPTNGHGRYYTEGTLLEKIAILPIKICFNKPASGI